MSDLLCYLCICQFDDLIFCVLSPPFTQANANKVHKGGGGKVRITIPEDIAATMESEWSRVIGEPTGIKSYTELRAQFSFLE